MKRHRKWTPGTLIAHLVALILALAVAALFYGFMVYQSAPSEDGGETHSTGTLLSELFPEQMPVADEDVPHIILSGVSFVDEQRIEGMVRDQACVQITDSYTMSNGRTVQTVVAWPQGYMEALLGSDWVPQRITGFTIGPLPATFYLGNAGSMIIAREEPFIYMIRVLGEDVDGQTVYALGVLAFIEGRKETKTDE